MLTHDASQTGRNATVPVSPPGVERGDVARNLRSALGAFLLGMILAWPIGLEQLLPPLLLLAPLLASGGLWRFRLRNDAYLKAGALFLLVYLLSGNGIFQPYRLITFARDFMLYATGIVLFAHLRRYAGAAPVEAAVGPLAAFFAGIGLAGALYAVLPLGGFASIGYHALPSGLRDTVMAQRALVKSLGEQLYFYGFTNRVSAIFSSPVHFAAVLMLCMPFAAHAARHRMGYLGGAMTWLATLLLVSLAQVRIAMVLTLLWPVIYLTIRHVVAPGRGPLAAMIVSVIVPILTLTVIASLPQLIAAFEVFFLERRAGSALTRIAIYEETLRMIVERPFLGYGTQIDIPYVDYPAGSHSTFLGLWFKHGIFGLMLMGLILLAPLPRLIRALLGPLSAARRHLLSAILASYLLYLAMLSLNEYIADVYHTTILFAVLAVLTATRMGPSVKGPGTV